MVWDVVSFFDHASLIVKESLVAQNTATGKGGRHWKDCHWWHQPPWRGTLQHKKQRYDRWRRKSLDPSWPRQEKVPKTDSKTSEACGRWRMTEALGAEIHEDGLNCLNWVSGWLHGKSAYLQVTYCMCPFFSSSMCLSVSLSMCLSIYLTYCNLIYTLLWLSLIKPKVYI